MIPPLKYFSFRQPFFAKLSFYHFSGEGDNITGGGLLEVTHCQQAPHPKLSHLHNIYHPQPPPTYPLLRQAPSCASPISRFHVPAEGGSINLIYVDLISIVFNHHNYHHIIIFICHPLRNLQSFDTTVLWSPPPPRIPTRTFGLTLASAPMGPTQFGRGGWRWTPPLPGLPYSNPLLLFLLPDGKIVWCGMEGRGRGEIAPNKQKDNYLRNQTSISTSAITHISYIVGQSWITLRDIW